jgi:lysophospholipase L1-like esterase
MFQAGTTTVTCTATDAIQRQGACTIDVVVNVPAAPTPRLVGTKFLAFGDSITKGENTQFLAGPLFIDTAHAYPTVLGQLLAARYTTQTPVVIEDGVSGESALDGTGRIEGDLNANAPNALLLLEGANDLAASNSFPADYLVNQVRNALQFDVNVAKSKGIKVFLSTQPPVVHCRGVSGPDCRDWAIRYTDLITPVNDAIRSLAAQSGVVLVDAYKALSTNTDLYIEPDGLHLTTDGQRILAEIFLAAIETNYEVPTTAGTQRKLLRAPTPVVRPNRVR